LGADTHAATARETARTPLLEGDAALQAARRHTG
jgi:hypothetical protein